MKEIDYGHVIDDMQFNTSKKRQTRIDTARRMNATLEIISLIEYVGFNVKFAVSRNLFICK